jgi:hypothetical protein
VRLSVTVVASIISAVVLAASVTVGAGEKAAISSKATTAKVDMAAVAKDLRQYASELRSIGSQMTLVAKSQVPGNPDNGERAQFETKRGDLRETATATQDLASRIEGMAMKADRGTLTRADMERLGVAAEPVVQMVDRATAGSTGRAINSRELNDVIRDVESQQETARNKRQVASTSFQNFDQKANQQYNLLSSVMKSMNEMRMGTVRNML